MDMQQEPNINTPPMEFQAGFVAPENAAPEVQKTPSETKLEIEALQARIDALSQMHSVSPEALPPVPLPPKAPIEAHAEMQSAAFADHAQNLNAVLAGGDLAKQVLELSQANEKAEQEFIQGKDLTPHNAQSISPYKLTKDVYNTDIPDAPK
jgi:hypothetical protein